MKSLILLSTLLFSFSVFSARVPTELEYNSYDVLFESEDSLKPLINLIKTNVLESNIAYNKKPIFVKGKSVFLTWVLAFRLNKVEGYRGSTTEALELLQLLIDKGVDINQPQPGIIGDTQGIPLLLVADTCSTEAFNMLIKNKVDLSLYNNAFMNAINSQDFNYQNIPLAKECEDIAARLIPFTKSFDPQRIYKVMGHPESEETKFEHPVVFYWGDNMDLLFSERIKGLLFTQFGIKFSKKPVGEAPTDEWYNEFKRKLGRTSPNNKFSDRPDQQHEDRLILWWNAQSDIQRQWSCYYSSFDEAVDLLLQAGVDKKWLTEQPDDPRAFWNFNGFGSFAVDNFRNYCNSIK